MRHRNQGRKINLHRKSILKNLTISLIKYGCITTTIAKAKELRCIIEPIINRAKNNNIYNRKYIFSYIRNNYIVSRLFDLGKLYILKNGGYTKIIRIGYRKGDNAPLVYISLVDYKF